MPRVFISFSGERSLQVARLLTTWLPDCLQTIQPFLSEAGIAKGAPETDDESALSDPYLTPEHVELIRRVKARSPWRTWKSLVEEVKAFD